tara:strand:+ start:166 stop:1293 length:1128 start_codon:yes stop_codon:yes gene_type:complete
MKKYLKITFLIIFYITSAQADHQKPEYDFFFFQKFKVDGSSAFHEFNKDLVQDKDVIQAIKQKDRTGLISYLLFENNKIVIDEESLPDFIENNNDLLWSKSIGKSLVSYVTGHAICEGYIDSVDVILDDWFIIEDTLYENQKLIDLLNMKAGDSRIIGEKNFSTDNKISNLGINVNTRPLEKIFKLNIFENAKKSRFPQYNYNALVTNIILNYTIFKSGDDYQKLLDKVFKEHVKVRDSVYFLKPIIHDHYNNLPYEPGRYSFYASRYDYLRIAKTMMDDWNSNNCVGKYLKTIYDKRIHKNRNSYKPKWVGGYTEKYGGQFHFDVIGLSKRKILGMDGFGGQQIIIDFDKQRIIVVHATDRHYNWKKLVYNKLK